MISRQHLPRYEFTQEGFDKLLLEQEQLTQNRVGAVKDLAEARAMGDLSENGYYKAARAKLSSIDSRLGRLKLMIKYAVILESSKSGAVDFGCKVTVQVGSLKREFQIVGKEESDPSAGKISGHSPIGQALMGKKKGEKVLVQIPAGEVEYEILVVE
ncbi:transcription elongation factor GreA [Candidatus Beckwithbacteria bacterium]|nr:transcription elongation factor GreA [Candidatus Beckwithbacteria bacterium]